MASTGNSEPDVEEIADGYLRFSDSLAPENFDPDSASDPNDPDEQAWNLVNSAIKNGPPERAWALVIAILQRSPDERLGFHTAGPLEDVVRRWGAALVDHIEAEAAADERFRWALGGIWLKGSGELPLDILARIVAASDGEIKPL